MTIHSFESLFDQQSKSVGQPESGLDDYRLGGNQYNLKQKSGSPTPFEADRFILIVHLNNNQTGQLISILAKKPQPGTFGTICDTIITAEKMPILVIKEDNIVVIIFIQHIDTITRCEAQKSTKELALSQETN
jgi:hypothetical protein